MYLDKDIISRVTDDKNFNKFLVLEFLVESTYPKSFAEIWNYLRYHSEKRGDQMGSEGRTVRDWLDELVTSKIVECDKSRRTWKWMPARNLHELENVAVKKSNIPYLLAWEKMFEKYQYLPFFSDIKGYIRDNREVIEEYGDKMGVGVYRIADFETQKPFYGEDWIRVFYTAIEDRSPLSFKYRSFDRNKGIANYENFMPYLLKEHNNRWYVVGKPEAGTGFRTIAIDRVMDVVSVNDDVEFDREPFDPDKHWEHSIGIYTGWWDENGRYSEKPVAITFEIKDGDRMDNIPYLETAPIHSSQTPKKLWKDKEGYAKVSLKTYPNADLVRKLRGFGTHNLRNIQPEYLSKLVFNG